MPSAIIHVPLHLKDSVERYITVQQQRESAFFQLKYRIVYSLTCAFCRKTEELSHATEQEGNTYRARLAEVAGRCLEVEACLSGLCREDAQSFEAVNLNQASADA